MTHLGTVLGWKYSHEPGISTAGGDITEWPASLGPQPDQAAIDAIVAEYEAQATVEAIKAEASRRILVKYPEWKQANMTARAVELQDLWRANGSWTAAETAEHTALLAAWAEVKAIRDASDTLEVNPPADPTDDAHWPA